MIIQTPSNPETREGGNARCPAHMQKTDPDVYVGCRTLGSVSEHMAARESNCCDKLSTGSGHRTPYHNAHG